MARSLVSIQWKILITKFLFYKNFRHYDPRVVAIEKETTTEKSLITSGLIVWDGGKHLPKFLNRLWILLIFSFLLCIVANLEIKLMRIEKHLIDIPHRWSGKL